MAVSKRVVRNRKTYSKPVLLVRGDIANLTLSCTDKDFGTNDGFTFLGQDITFNCS